MKKVANISKKISNNTFSYTGKGAFEQIVKNNKEYIIKWLEELLPLQEQMQILDEQNNVQFQKRNYIRILTKLLPDEYTEFVNINILLRDIESIKNLYVKNINNKSFYEKLILNNYLKYPGKSTKYVPFDIFEEFIELYSEELNIKIEKIEPIKIVDNSKEFKEKSQKKDKINWTNLLLGR